MGFCADLYRLWVAANSATGPGTPRCKRRKSAPHNVCLRTFNVCTPLWRLCAGDLRVYRVFSYLGFPARVQLPPLRLEPSGAAANHYWRFTMFKATPNPPETDTDSDAPSKPKNSRKPPTAPSPITSPLLATNHRDAVTIPALHGMPRHRRRSPAGQCLRRHAVDQRDCGRSGGRCGRLTPLGRLGDQPNGGWRAVVGGAGAGSLRGVADAVAARPRFSRQVVVRLTGSPVASKPRSYRRIAFCGRYADLWERACSRQEPATGSVDQPGTHQ